MARMAPIGTHWLRLPTGSHWPIGRTDWPLMIGHLADGPDWPQHRLAVDRAAAGSGVVFLDRQDVVHLRPVEEALVELGLLRAGAVTVEKRQDHVVAGSAALRAQAVVNELLRLVDGAIAVGVDLFADPLARRRRRRSLMQDQKCLSF